MVCIRLQSTMQYWRFSADPNGSTPPTTLSALNSAVDGSDAMQLLVVALRYSDATGEDVPDRLAGHLIQLWSTVTGGYVHVNWQLQQLTCGVGNTIPQWLRLVVQQTVGGGGGQLTYGGGTSSLFHAHDENCTLVVTTTSLSMAAAASSAAATMWLERSSSVAPALPYRTILQPSAAAATSGADVNVGDVVVLRSSGDVDRSYIGESSSGDGRLRAIDGRRADLALPFRIVSITTPFPGVATVALQELPVGLRVLQFDVANNAARVRAQSSPSTLAPPLVNMWLIGGSPLRYGWLNSFELEQDGKSWRHNGSPGALLTLGDVFVASTYFYLEYRGQWQPLPDSGGAVRAGHVISLRTPYSEQQQQQSLAFVTTTTSASPPLALQQLSSSPLRAARFLVTQCDQGGGADQVSAARLRLIEVSDNTEVRHIATHQQLQLQPASGTGYTAWLAATPTDVMVWRATRPGMAAPSLPLPIEYGGEPLVCLQHQQNSRGWRISTGSGLPLELCTMWHDQSAFHVVLESSNTLVPPTAGVAPVAVPAVTHWLSGAAANAQLSPGINWTYYPPTQHDVWPVDADACQQLGFRSVRALIAMQEGVDYFINAGTGQVTGFSAEFQQRAQRYSDWAHRRQLWLIKGVRWTTALSLTTLPLMWQALSALWQQDSPRVIWELFNEPNSADGSDPFYTSQLPACVQAIRSAPGQSQRCVMVGPPQYHNIFAYPQMTVLTGDPYVIYTLHCYDPQRLTQAGKWNALKMAENFTPGNELSTWPSASTAFDVNETLAEMQQNFNQVQTWAMVNGDLPIHMGEFGIFSWLDDLDTQTAPPAFGSMRESWIRAMVGEFQRLGWSYAYFDWHSTWQPQHRNTFAVWQQQRMVALSLPELRAVLGLPP
jgi:hypothetical protein